MSLENLNKMLKDAEDNNYAVPQFNVWNLEWISAVLDKCQELKTPVILGVSQNGAKYMGGFYVVTQMIKAYIKKNNITIPVAIHLDHASSFEACKEAIDEGKAYLKYQGKQNTSWDEYTKEFNIVSHDQKQEDVDEDALALLQQYD